MIKNFETVCVAMATARPMEQRAEKALEVLMNHESGMRAMEIAEACGLPMDGYCRHSSMAEINHALSWLKELGMIRRYEVDGEPIEVEKQEWVCEEDTTPKPPMMIEVDGVKYFREALPYRPRGRWEWVKKTVVPKIPYFEVIR